MIKRAENCPVKKSNHPHKLATEFLTKICKEIRPTQGNSKIDAARGSNQSFSAEPSTRKPTIEKPKIRLFKL